MSDFSVSSTSAVNSSAYLDRVPTQTLDQNEFFKLLVAQLTSQDPLNPQKDTEFIGQMTQFSALETNRSMATEIQTLRANQLLGQTVELNLGGGASLLAKIEAVDSVNGTPRLVVGDRTFALGDVLRVEQPAPPEPTGPLTKNV